MPRMVFFTFLLLFTSCIENTGNQQNSTRQILPITSFEHLINQKDLLKKEDVNFNADHSLLNQDYPMEFWLYQNNKYFYDLPNLGEGIGDWSFENGILKLENGHHIKAIDLTIDMQYSIYYSLENEARIEFSDRFGMKNIELELQAK